LSAARNRGSAAERRMSRVDRGAAIGSEEGARR
jgi:hypothetical protein